MTDTHLLRTIVDQMSSKRSNHEQESSQHKDKLLLKASLARQLSRALRANSGWNSSNNLFRRRRKESSTSQRYGGASEQSRFNCGWLLAWTIHHVAQLLFRRERGFGIIE